MFRELISALFTTQIQESVDMVDIWTNQNDMRLNSEKCKEMIIDFSRNYSLTSGIGEQVLERVEHAKMLGVTISNNLTWSKHVDNIGRIRLVKFRPTILGSAHPRTDKMLLTEAGQSNGKFCPRSNWKNYLN